MKLNFIKNIQLDIKNWQNAVEAQGYGVDWAKYIPPDLSIECVKNNECLTNYLKNKYYNSGDIDLYIEKLKKDVDSSEIQNDLEFLMNQKFPDKIKISVFITTFQRCPYNIKENFFYLRYRIDDENFKKSTTNIYHELMHFLFHRYYWQRCRNTELKEDEIHNIKESFTVLLNSILIKRNLPIDRGYKVHQKLREEILKFWQENNDFEFVLEKIIKK